VRRFAQLGDETSVTRDGQFNLTNSREYNFFIYLYHECTDLFALQISTEALLRRVASTIL